MKIDRDHGGTLAARLRFQGCALIGTGARISHYGFYGEDFRGGEYELAQAEEAARDVLAAIAEYRRATAEPPAPLVPLVPRPVEPGRTYRETMPQRDYGDESGSGRAA